MAIAVAIANQPVVVLADECGAGSDALDAYVASVRAGAEVSPSVGGEEAAELTDALRRTRAVHVTNFQAQAGTACYWVRLELDDGSRDARFVLEDTAESRQVVRASLRRECECPDPDFEQRCRLRGDHAGGPQ